MKVTGNNTYIEITMRDLFKVYTLDAIVPVSKKGLKAYMMAAGIKEEEILAAMDTKPVSLKVIDDTEQIAPITEVKPEVLPPIELNISDGDW